MKAILCALALMISTATYAEKIKVLSRADLNYAMVKPEFEASPNGDAWIYVSFNTSHNENSDGNWRDVETARVSGLHLDRATNEIRYNTTACAKVYPRRFGMPIVKNTGLCKLEAVRAREQDPNDWYGRSRRVWQVWMTVNE